MELNRLVDRGLKDAIQFQATKFVHGSLPINLYWFSPGQLKKPILITAKGMGIIACINGKVRVIDIEGAGAHPCGRSHVPYTSIVGEVIRESIA
jgi:Ser-tRNA(Ala) deacylase AlaX